MDGESLRRYYEPPTIRSAAMRGPRFRSRTGLAALGAVVAGTACAGVATWFLLLRDVAEPTTVSEAVTNFRAVQSGQPAPVPQGVYVYGTGGFEKIDALTGVTHRYPPRSTITVTKAPCGVRMRWDVLRGRSTVWTFCIGAKGWTTEREDERHTFFGHTDRTTYACGDVPFWPKGAARARLSYVCSTPTVREHGHVGFVGRELLNVGTRRTQTVHLERRSSLTGATRGTSADDFWLAAKPGVPVRIVMVSRTTNDSAIGPVHYEEHVVLELASLTPRR